MNTKISLSQARDLSFFFKYLTYNETSLEVNYKTVSLP